MKGSTLIETLLYIALLSILMTGVFSFAQFLIFSAPSHDTIESDNELILKQFYE